MAKARLYQTVYGLETGDIVRTSYHTGPYEVIGLTRPRHIRNGVFASITIHEPPVFTILCGRMRGAPGYPTPIKQPFGWLNEVCFEAGRYLMRNDEIFVEKPVQRPDMIIDMFESFLTPVDEPYPFQSGVDYDTPYKAFHCDRCGLDFNHEKQRGNWANPPCPRCQHPVSLNLFVFRRFRPNESAESLA